MGQTLSKRWPRTRCCACVEDANQSRRTPHKVDDSHKTQTSSWLPPRENWQDSSGLPYGWETALDGQGKPYFINHAEKYTTRDDPRHDPDYVEPPRPREVELVRDLDKGFGFVAGSEKPVVVRFVTEGGPSVDKLLPGDLILKINGEEVRRAPRDKVIELVRSCRHSITLTVCQPYFDNSSRKSAILTAAKKARLKDNPSRVRFSDAVLVNGASVASQQSPQESYVPFMPNVLKVFLENGQTKSFKYDNKTTVKDVVHSLQEKLNISCTQHFCLMLQNMKGNIPGKMTLLQDQETLAELASKPGARHFRCLFRVAFVPLDAYDLLKEDPIAFEYFYMQCCNDVVHERFVSEMKYDTDTALRLSALHIQQHAVSNNITGKISIKAIEKETGLDKFVSPSLMETMKSKDLRKMLAQYLKSNQNLTAPGQKQLTALQAKLHYMKIVSELKIFGSRVFMVTLLGQKTEAMVLVGPKAGISVVTNIKSYTLTQLADFDQIEAVKVTKDAESMHRVDISVKSNDKVETIGLGLLTEDAQNFVLMVAGYYRIFVDRDKRIVERTVGKNTADPDVPAYEDQHRVLPSQWAYPEDLVSEVVVEANSESTKEAGRKGEDSDDRVIDLSCGAPEYEYSEENAHFRLSKDKEDRLASVKNDVLIQAPPSSMPSRPDLSDIIALASPETTRGGHSPYNHSSAITAVPSQTNNPFHQNLSFEEGVTSFGLAAPVTGAGGRDQDFFKPGGSVTVNGNHGPSSATVGEEGDSMSLNSSSASNSSSVQGASFRVASRGSVASSSTDLTQLYRRRESEEAGGFGSSTLTAAAPDGSSGARQPPSPISLVTFHASPVGRRSNPTLIAQSPANTSPSTVSQGKDNTSSASAAAASVPSSSVLEVGLTSAGTSPAVRLFRSEAEINHQHQNTMINGGIPSTLAVGTRGNSNSNTIYSASTISFGSSSVSTDSGFAPARSFSPDSTSSVSTSTSTIKEGDTNNTLTPNMDSTDANNHFVHKMRVAPPPPPISRSISADVNASKTSSPKPNFVRSGSHPVTTLLPTSRMNGGGLDLDSDDADSVGTPSGSPAKGRARLNRGPSVESALQSFGLHSPDNWPDGADVDFIGLDGLDHGERVTPTDAVEAFNPAFAQADHHSRRRLYLDPDIIDLTNFPPPETPDNDSMMDFTELSNFPPPVFSASSSSIASLTTTDPDLLDVDVDALIAQFTIPPPPPSSLPDAAPGSHLFSSSGGSRQGSVEENNTQRLLRKFTSSGDSAGAGNEEDGHDEFAHLIIPPPPESSTLGISTDDVEEISSRPTPSPPPPPPRRPSSDMTQSTNSTSQKINKSPAPLPPSSSLTVSSSSQAAQTNRTSEKEIPSVPRRPTARGGGRHKRSSSLDITAVRAAQFQQAQGLRGSQSMDTDGPNDGDRASSEAAAGKSTSSLSTSVEALAGDSPATVSEKLHLLLQSLPNFRPELPPRESKVVRTGSLRMYHRSASLDTDLHQRPKRMLPSTPSPSPPVPQRQPSHVSAPEASLHAYKSHHGGEHKQSRVDSTASLSSTQPPSRRTSDQINGQKHSQSLSSTLPTSPSTPLAASTPVPIFNRSSSLRLNRSSLASDSRPRSSSYDPFALGANPGLVRSSSETLATSSGDKSKKHSPHSGKPSDASPSSSSGGSESFASLKAKLREYRDMLLNKNKSSSSSSKKYTLVPSSPSSAHKAAVDNSSIDMTGKKGSLGRSSSLAKLMAQFQRRGSKLSLDSLQDNNWELKEAKPVTPTFYTSLEDPNSLDQEFSTEPAASCNDKKSIPVVRDPLGLNRPSLRPVSTNLLNQENVYLTYTYPLRFDPTTSRGRLADMLSDSEPEQEGTIEVSAVTMEGKCNNQNSVDTAKLSNPVDVEEKDSNSQRSAGSSHKEKTHCDHKDVNVKVEEEEGELFSSRND